MSESPEFDAIEADTAYDEDETIEALQQIGGIYIPFELPTELKSMKRSVITADTLVLCHGRSSRVLRIPRVQSENVMVCRS